MRRDGANLLSRRRVWVYALLAFALAAGALLPGLATGSATAGGTSAETVSRLRAELASAQRDARFWQQLTSAFTPGKELGINSMSDHSLLILPGGIAMALHFDNMNLAKAQNLNWVAMAIPGKFTRADQARANRLYGPGFTHFHNFDRDVHAGRSGEKGVWFVHVGTRDFRSPFGAVRSGRVDTNFMPTRPPR